MTQTTVYPLVLEPILKEKVWGGRRLEHYGKVVAAGSQVGESWEVADMPATSPSGGGGDEARSIIWEVRGPTTSEPPTEEGCEVVMVLSGELTLDAVDESYAAVRLAAGNTAVLPAAAGPVTAFWTAADVTYLRIRFGPSQRQTTAGGEPGT